MVSEALPATGLKHALMIENLYTKTTRL